MRARGPRGRRWPPWSRAPRRAGPWTRTMRSGPRPRRSGCWPILLLVCGQGDHEARPRRVRVLQMHGPPVILCDGADDGQAEPEALVARADGAACEPLEDARAVLLGDTVAGVAHPQAGL